MKSKMTLTYSVDLMMLRGSGRVGMFRGRGLFSVFAGFGTDSLAPEFVVNFPG